MSNLESLHKEYSSYTDEKLIEIMSQYKSFSESYIAAKIILGEREKNNNNEKHRATLAVSRKANRIAIIAIIIASISLIVILIDFISRSIPLVQNTNLKQQQLKQTLELNKPSSLVDSLSHDSSNTKQSKKGLLQLNKK